MDHQTWLWLTTDSHQHLIAYGFLFWGAALGVLLRGRALRRQVEWNLRANHFVPVALQGTIIAYWLLHQRALESHLLSLLLVALFACLFDALVNLLRRGVVSFSVSALPMVLSIFLFVWMFGPGLSLYYLSVIVGILTKHFVRFRGSHVFNPSAIGAIGFGLVLQHYGLRYFYQDQASMLSGPPNMTELVLLLALIPMVRFRFGASTLMAYSTMLLFDTYDLTAARGSGLFPGPYWTPWLISITLLSNDPMTIPRTLMGRAAFGLLLGTCNACSSAFTILVWDDDFWSKLLAVAVANLFVPAIRTWEDTPGSSLWQWREVLEPRYGFRVNLVAVMLFVLLFITSFTSEVKHGLHTYNHQVFESSGIRWDLPEEVYARHFSFPLEVRHILFRAP